MAVYKMTMEDLAQYLSGFVWEIRVKEVVSSEGYRIGRGSRYMITVDSISHEKLAVKVDCFLNIDKSLTVVVYLPGCDYHARTKELSSAYRPGDSTAHKFKLAPRTFEFDIEEVNLRSYDDFARTANELKERIEMEIALDLNKFQPDSEWKFEGIELDVKFDSFMRK